MIINLFRTKRKTVSIKGIIIFTFVLIILTFSSILGYFIFTNWINSARQTTEIMAAEDNEAIYNHIDSFLSELEAINKANHKLIENVVLDITNKQAMEQFFVGVLESRRNSIYSFSFGTATGEYYGACRNKDGLIEIMKANEDTEGDIWYYMVDENMNAGEIFVKLDGFDPRTRPWYKAAEEAGVPTFSPIYRDVLTGNLTVTSSLPVYNEKNQLRGVIETSFFITEIDNFLSDIVQKYNGYAFIIEKETGKLVSNSWGIDNSKVLKNGNIQRYTYRDINNIFINKVFEQYDKLENKHFHIGGETEDLYVFTEDYQKKGIDWIIISAVPENWIINDAHRNIRITVVAIIITAILSVVAYFIVMKKLLKPMDNLLEVADSIASGNYPQRAVVVRNDEIGKITLAFNKVADKLQYLISNLEETVNVRTAELEENKSQLQLILDSTAEAIYGIDLEGKCTFCNKRCIKMLGYKNQEDLLGKNMHLQTHHSCDDGSPVDIEDCKIMQSIRQGQGIHADDEIFRKADGKPFNVEYDSYPQMKNGKILGAVITFVDITESKKREEKIRYLSYHDSLTGLHNRRSFEQNLKKVDTPDNLPLSVIFADINALKMTNDIFGHTAGDTLIKKSSDILKKCCRENDLIARVGGDEFVILLPRISGKEVDTILSRIKASFSKARVAAIKCSISLGSDTKKNAEQSIEEILAEAENAMYKDKMLNRKSANSEIIHTLVETLHTKSEVEKRHAIVVSGMCSDVGAALNLEETEIQKLKRAGYMHDIGKITLDDSILHSEALEKEEHEKMKQHSVVGYRILNLFEDTSDLSEVVYCHHERWDGKGYPRGLKGEEIPFLSRIVSIVETYERVLNREGISNSKQKAINAIRDGSGTKFEPQITKIFINMVKEN